MPRYRLTVEYDGAPYKGAQLQQGVATVQGSLERAIAGFARVEARVHVAGRTDTGVHATGQVIHFDLERDWRPDVVRDAVNAHLVPRADLGAFRRDCTRRLPCPLLGGGAALSLPGDRPQAAAGA